MKAVSMLDSWVTDKFIDVDNGSDKHVSEMS
jgi:hypothetical protein